MLLCFLILLDDTQLLIDRCDKITKGAVAPQSS